jgi:murein DD-endopeptidase MepM/ murein hydrolase activator NlpD
MRGKSSLRLFSAWHTGGRWTIAVALLFGFTSQAAAALAKNQPVHRSASAQVWTKYDCGQGNELRIRTANATQGTLLVAEMGGAKPMVDVSGKWTERDISFWRSESGAAKGTTVWRAFVGVDLEQAAGEYKFGISAKTADGETVSCEAKITVRIGKFATERLKVAPNFVEPNPEQLAKAQEDQKKLRELYATVTPEKLWNGPFRIPLDGVKSGGNFGKRRILNGKSNSPHTGVDFPSPTGTPVHAAQRGRVVVAGELYYSGNTVLIDHGLGVYTLYGHFSEIDVNAGDMVEKGAVLGKVGATGRVTGPHLHWGLTVDRARVNALEIVGKAVSGE